MSDTELNRHGLVLSCVVFGTCFSVLSALSTAILVAVNWRPWRIYSWIFARKWPWFLQGPQLSLVAGLLCWAAWAFVLSPIVVLLLWGMKLIALLDHTTIGLAVIMAGTALLLAFYAIMLWWRTQWQSSRAVFVLLLLAVTLLCGYEFAAVYVSAGRSASHQYSPSAFFFGVSAIAMGINMLFICKMVFHGSGLDVDEYVRRSYKFAHADCIEVGPVACMPEPPDPRDPALHKQNRAFRFAFMYFGSVLVLVGYSVLYGLTARKARWLGGVTSAAVMILDANVGACLFGFQLLKRPVVALVVAGVYRIILISFGVYYWYLGHCISYAVVATVLLGAAVKRHLAVLNPSAARRAALEHTVVRLREGFRKKGLGSSSSFSDGRTSSAMRSSSVEAAQLGVALEAMSRAGIRAGEIPYSGLASQHHGSIAAQHGAIGVIEECAEDGSSPMPDDSDRAVARQVGLGAGIEEKSLTPRQAVSSEADAGLIPGDRQGLSERYRPISHGPDFGHSHGHSLESFSSIVGPLDQLDHLALMFQERLNDPRIMAMLRGRRGAEQDLTSLLEDKGLDPNFAVMLKEKGLDPTLLALLQRSSLDADNDHRDNTDIGTGGNPSQNASLPEEGVTWSEELRRKKWETWVHPIRFLVQLFAGTPERAWVLFSVLFVQETILIAIFRPQNVTVINASHEQFEFGFSALLLSPVVCSIMAFFRIMKAEEMYLTARARKYGLVAWILNTSVGLLLAFLSKSSIILGLALAVPLIAASLSVALPLWVRNGYRFYKPKASEQGDGSQPPQTKGICGQGQDMPMTVAIIICIGAIIGLGLIISFKPLDDLSYSGWSGPQPSSDSPYTSSLYLGWAIASALVLIITGLLPAVSWFATYRFSFSSAVCVAIFIVVLVTSCGGSYMGIVHARDGRVPVQADFIAAILPLMCIPAALLLGCGLYKWKDEGWQLSRGVYACLGVGLLLLLGAISAIIAMIDPWMVGVAFLLFLVMMVLTIGVVHHWASHNFYLTRMETILVCLSTFVLALAAFLVGLLADEPFVGASVGYFAFLFLLGGRSLTVLLSPPVVVYSPRVLPVYVYDAHADCAKNVSGAFLVLYGIALGTAGWGVVASLEIYPPFAGAAVSATTLVVAFGFAVSRPQSTVKRMEDALHFLKKDTIVQAIARSSTKTRNALSGTYSAPQRSASSAALLVGDAAMARDKAGNFVLPRADVLKLRERLRNEELAAGLFWCKPGVGFIRHDSTLDVGYRRKLCAHARILALEEAIDTEWVYMWDKFGGYLLLVLGLAARAERVQDEVRLRLFLDSIGSSDLSAKEIRSWTTEDRKRFEMVQEDYMREKEMEEELMQQRREEEGKGKERRKALLEKEERRRREIEASVIASVPDVGTKEAAAMAAAVRAVGGDVLFDESKAGDQVLSIARHILVAQRARRAQETGVTGAQCIIDDEPRSVPRPCGVLDPSLCGSRKVTFSAAVLVQPESGPICLMGSEAQQRICWEILIAGAEQGLEAGQVGLRLVVKGAGQTTLVKQWNIGNTSLADGRWHTVTVTLDAEVGEAATYLDGHFDGAAPLESLNGLQIPAEKGIWEDGTEVWVGIRPPMDLDAFGRSDSEGNDSRMHVMDVFLWGRLLTEDEIMSVHHSTSSSAEEYNEHNLPDDDWRGSPIESPMEEWAYEVPDLDLNDHDELYWDDQPANGRKRKAEKETLAIDMDYISRKLRRPKMETQEEVTQRMRALELAVKEALAARGETHFTDQEFPPTNHSLHVDPDHPMPKLQVVREWLRPGAAVREASPISPPCLFSGPANASDVCQGRLGDCWFLSAVAVLTEASKIAEVIVTPEFNEEGIYTVRFCIQGEWVAVVVDDWIPCEARGKPAFATSRKGNELWVSILEKAYAKLHGSYEALDAGVVQDALVDLTGGAGEEIDMTSPHVQLDLASGRLWTQLVRFKQEGFLLGAGSPSGSDASVSSSGIVQGHAYSLLQVCEVDGHKLVQIRNPWANEVEWNGPWSDLSAEWTDRMKHKLKYTPQAADGVFWMSWQDFQLHFRSLYVCRIYPPEMRYSVRGQWRSSSAGGCQDYDTWHQNPQFHLKAVGADARLPIHVFVTLTQIQGVGFSSRSRPGYRNVQSGGDSSLFYIGMRIIKTRGRRSGPNIYMHEAVTGTDYVNTREIPCEMVLEPDPDGYTIVPTTYAPGQECQFLLSVFTKAAITLEPL